MALVERRSNLCNSFSDYASRIPLALLLNTLVDGLSAAHRARDCHFGYHGSRRVQGLDRVSRFTGGRRLPRVPTGASDGLYIYRRNALPDQEFGGGAEDVPREKALPIPSNMPTMRATRSRGCYEVVRHLV